MAFERWSRLLLLLHAGLAIALCGASTHLAIGSLKLLRRRPFPPRLIRIYGQTIGVLYVAVFGWGLLAYPTYRYFVRGLYLDRYAKWASNLFDIKENLAALALPLALGLFALAQRCDPRGDQRQEPQIVPVVAVLALSVWAVVMFSVVSGLLVTCVKGV